MRALLLNGAKAGDGSVDRAGDVLQEELQVRGWTVDLLTLRDLKIAPCSGCFGCWTKTPGRCPTEDASQMIARLLVHCDLLALLTPITFGGYSSEIKKALDRIICIALPFFRKIAGEVHHQLRYDRQPNLLVLGIVEEPDEESEAVFQALVARNAINFASPAHVVGTLRKEQSGDVLRQQVRGLLGRLEARA